MCLATSACLQPDIKIYITAPTARSGCSFFSPSLCLHLPSSSHLPFAEIPPPSGTHHHHHTVPSSPGVRPGKHAARATPPNLIATRNPNLSIRLRAVLMLISLVIALSHSSATSRPPGPLLREIKPIQLLDPSALLVLGTPTATSMPTHNTS